MIADRAPFDRFESSLATGDVLSALRDGLIGEGAPVPGPFGVHPLVYADYVASGRSLRQVEDFILEHVLPYYANSHTEASFCGMYMTRTREAARKIIAAQCGATDDYATIFVGSGATAGINRLVELLGVGSAAREGTFRPVVFIGPYEHHSNILPWRESGAEIVTIAEAAQGGPDLDLLEAALKAAGPERLKVGAFSAASNVTGVMTDVDAVSAMLRRHGAAVMWDYAGGGPYLSVDMRAGTEFQKDAIVISPHKFLGGPGASGVLVVRRQAVTLERPVCPGGGTVRFVSPWGHDYSANVVSREESGTPNVIGDIRAALAFLVKDAIGQSRMDSRHAQLRERALQYWRRNDRIEILGNSATARSLPIFSIRVRDKQGDGFIHQQLFTRMLSDRYGVQARGGCACAGPYAHDLLGIGREHSLELRNSILSGEEIEKPGWTRLNLSVLLDDQKAQFIIGAVDELARDAAEIATLYHCDKSTARFTPLAA
ncbi:aminotransferase class V-fold PLP-dependent enzyme [Acetobacter sacchari]|uniref:Aminotransferase class V-fold PLP-dependent enzyme n=1 Tax=Acetobacter sacchari TaxID=2661687 RepID=A0ABS3LRZ6_9PROT|nr:aminotransferase class V-fold PLP-dependent enzyme [Acetobacter sacchari]MBO1358670.1 aminotransferase class V-fold PLP-dependent enzyme [Acetobacter sacchari]